MVESTEASFYYEITFSRSLSSSKGDKGKNNGQKFEKVWMLLLTSASFILKSDVTYDPSCFCLLLPQLMFYERKKGTVCVSYFSLPITRSPEVLNKTNYADYTKQASFAVALGFALYEGDLDEPDSNSLFFVFLIDFKSQSFAEHQSVIVASGPHESPVMRSVARAPTFIQLEGEVILTGVEGVAGFWSDWVEASGG